MRLSRQRLVEYTIQLTVGAAIGGISAALVRHRRPRRTRGPEHRSIVVVDMAGFGRWRDPDQLLARAALTSAMRAAFQSAGVAWSQLSVEDRGDGMIVLVPATVSKVDLLDPILPALTAAIHEHNTLAADAPRVRLRVAVHAGEIHRDAYGWAGADLNMACRLVNDESAYASLRRHPRADLVLVVSDLVHANVVRHGYRTIDPSTYTPIEAAVKELRTLAWIHVPALVTEVEPFRRSDAG